MYCSSVLYCTGKLISAKVLCKVQLEDEGCNGVLGGTGQRSFGHGSETQTCEDEGLYRLGVCYKDSLNMLYLDGRFENKIKK